MSAIEPVPQMGEDALKTMSHDKIVEAHNSGALADLLGQQVPVRVKAGTTQLTKEDLAPLTPQQVAGLPAEHVVAALHHLSPDQVAGLPGEHVVAAHEAGRLHHLFAAVPGEAGRQADSLLHDPGQLDALTRRAQASMGPGDIAGEKIR